MPTKIAFSTLLLFCSFTLLAQQDFSCINDHIQLEKNLELVQPSPPSSAPRNITTKYLNTVVHVIYNTTYDDVPDSTIQLLIEDLNKLFRAENIDTSKINFVHQEKMTDAQIRFCLAETDPDGLPTNGITHTFTENSSFNTPNFFDSTFVEEVKTDSLGGASPWDIARYFNIWIAPMGSANLNANYGVPRPEYFPLNNLTPNGSIPGALMDMDNFTLTLPTTTMPSILAHECGHALGMLHTFHSDASDSLGLCSGTDFMDDTPTCRPTIFCDGNSFENTCTDTIGIDEPDNIANFMNYGCMLMFTPNQVETLHNNLSLAPAGLYNETACGFISKTDVGTPEPAAVFKIFPNPNSGYFSVNFSPPISSTGQLTLYNAIGQKVYVEKIGSQKMPAFDLRVEAVAPGVHFLILETEEGIWSEKIVVQKN